MKVISTVLMNSEIYAVLQCFDTVGWASGRAYGLYRIECRGANVVICLVWGADNLHMVQPMPLPPHHVCFIKIQTGLAVWVPAYKGCPGKRVR